MRATFRTNSLSQYLYNSLTQPSGYGRWQSVRRKALSFSRRMVVSLFKDPLVKYRIGNYDLLIPTSNDVGLYRIGKSEFLNNQGRLSRCVSQKYPDLHVVVVGANFGDGIAIIKSMSDVPVLGIEGEPRIFSLLEHNVSAMQSVVVENVFLGEAAATSKGALVYKEGTAGFEAAASENSLEIKTLPAVLEAYPRFLKAKLLVIDTDGFDGKILRGAEAWLRLNKPVVFFEYDPFLLAKQGEDSVSILNMLRAAGYEGLAVYFNNGEYLCSLSLDQRDLLQELTEFVMGRDGGLYYDIGVFAPEDRDLVADLKKTEIEHFRRVRSGLR